MYSITATVTERTPEGWDRTRQVPTFYLDPRVQGIVSAAHAERIALDILDPFNRGGWFVTAFAV
jgi:hypothetical protein